MSADNWLIPPFQFFCNWQRKAYENIMLLPLPYHGKEQNRSFIFVAAYIKVTICEYIEENINHKE